MVARKKNLAMHAQRMEIFYAENLVVAVESWQKIEIKSNLSVSFVCLFVLASKVKHKLLTRLTKIMQQMQKL